MKKPVCYLYLGRFSDSRVSHKHPTGLVTGAEPTRTSVSDLSLLPTAPSTTQATESNGYSSPASLASQPTTGTLRTGEVSPLASPTSSTSSSSGLSQSDKIALGVGLAFGLATVILAIIGIYLQWR
jgi:hypothetical protein